MNFARPLGWTLGLLLLGSAASLTTEHTAYAQSRPVTGTVYVLTDGEWQEAFVIQATGRISQGRPSWSYTVEYADGKTETQINATRIRTIEQAQAEGLTNDVYDLSTQAGIDQMLSTHNNLRQQVGVDDLSWSTELATSAQEWADTLIAENQFSHSPASQRQNDQIGENLTGYSTFGSGTALQTPTQAAQGWINEAQHYNYETNRCASGQICGHYTQMIWADTTEVGCAVARTENKKREVWVCHYAPGGNIVGQRPY
ncbi:MAG: hypothetical protein F6K11_12035 [Leptolyngbya sp. SIO3F4]|nr:hypothetical protein [Leptolyngbya sp. SIO3F4]